MMKKLTLLCLIIFCPLLVFPQSYNEGYVNYLDYQAYIDGLFVIDTTENYPPDIFDTDPVITWAPPETLYISWTPGEIDSLDVQTLRFVITTPINGIGDGQAATPSPKTINIPWGTASADSDTFMIYTALNFTEQDFVDTAFTASVVTTLIDSNSNSASMSAETEKVFFNTPDKVPTISLTAIDTSSVDIIFNPTDWSLPSSWNWLSTVYADTGFTFKWQINTYLAGSICYWAYPSDSTDYIYGLKDDSTRSYVVPYVNPDYYGLKENLMFNSNLVDTWPFTVNLSIEFCSSSFYPYDSLYIAPDTTSIEGGDFAIFDDKTYNGSRFK
ncbi:MAG: hypothetical protein A2Y94_13890 [Caldithrix sp. RBG_13_44_9]|nr:MAG: hypothetical protein A2Y94_13890 [Caldithrix sp. RBG_13_44_9]